MVEIFKTIAAVIGCLSGIITLSMAIIKPFRKWIIDSFVRQSQAKEVKAKIDDMTTMMKTMLDNNSDFNKRLKRVEQNVLDNEADRIRAELFDCGNRCRRGIRLHPEEMDHIRAIYRKYKDVLNQNHEGDAEFDFINQYYNQQTFPPYHTTQNDYEER